ncbi:MAG: galactokinase [Treponema sp.]|nr:galactokinase [Treponema sp.]
MKILNDEHFSEYEEYPAVTAKAPCRFHMIGEHTWFFKDKTLSFAADIPVYVAVSKRDDAVLKFYFVQTGEHKKANITSVKYKKEDRWANAVKAVFYGFSSGGYEIGGFNLTVYSPVLPSAGFGITTAIKAATAIALRKLFNLNCSDSQLLQVLERGNKRFLQINNYIADNYACLFSKKGNLIITDHNKNTWDYVPFNFEGKIIVIVDTHVPRFTVWNEEVLFEPSNALVLGDLKESKANVLGGWRYITNVTDINEGLSTVSELTKHRLLSVMREHNDIQDAVDGINKGDFFKFARSINHSHESMRDYYEASCPEIDWILKRVGELEPNLDTLRNPVSCGRITGKGFGRCLYAVIRESDLDKFKEKLQDFEKIFAFKCDMYVVTPSDGACIFKD